MQEEMAFPQSCGVTHSRGKKENTSSSSGRDSVERFLGEEVLLLLLIRDRHAGGQNWLRANIPSCFLPPLSCSSKDFADVCQSGREKGRNGGEEGAPGQSVWKIAAPSVCGGAVFALIASLSKKSAAFCRRNMDEGKREVSEMPSPSRPSPPCPHCPRPG